MTAAFRCKHCGRFFPNRKWLGWTPGQMLTECFTCHYWKDQAEAGKRIITPDFIHYRHIEEREGGFRGHGGRPFLIMPLKGGSMWISRNLWYQGEIPKHLRKKFGFIPNANVESMK